MAHRVVVKQETSYPFTKYWACVCGTKMKSSIMGPDLYREFSEHEKSQAPPTTKHRQEFPGHSSGSLNNGVYTVFYCIDCDWDGKEKEDGQTPSRP